MDREYEEVASCLYIDRSARGGVKGEELAEMLVAVLVALALGEGVKGIRPPAVFVLKRPWWLFRGVDTEGVAIVSTVLCDRIDNLMFRSESC